MLQRGKLKLMLTMDPTAWRTLDTELAMDTDLDPYMDTEVLAIHILATLGLALVLPLWQALLHLLVSFMLPREQLRLMHTMDRMPWATLDMELDLDLDMDIWVLVTQCALATLDMVC